MANLVSKVLLLQNLPPKEAHFTLEVAGFLTKMEEKYNLKLKNSSLLLGISGGVDSTALLAFCLLYKEKFQLKLNVIHIDHALREESAQEARFVQNLCQEFAIPCQIVREEVKKRAEKERKGIEEMARIVRYEAYKKTMIANACDYLFLAHHLNDLAEDVIMRQIRGTSLDKSFGMQIFDEERALLRPFLLFEKELLESFVKACGLDYVEDSSNFSMDYLRNRVRHEILPLFIKENPSYLKQIKNNYLQAESDKDYWQKQVAAYFPEQIFSKEWQEMHESHAKYAKQDFSAPTLLFKLDRKMLKSEEKALRLRVLAKALTYCETHNSSSLLENLEALILKNESNKKLDANNNKEIIISKNYIEFYQKK